MICIWLGKNNDGRALFTGKTKMVEMILIMNLQNVIKQLMIWTSFLPAIVTNHSRSISVSLLFRSHLWPLVAWLVLTRSLTRNNL